MSKRPGRPRIDPAATSIRTSFRLPTPQYDDLCSRAKIARVSMSEYIRRHLPTSPKFVTLK
jgi:hypothetical protein